MKPLTIVEQPEPRRCNPYRAIHPAEMQQRLDDAERADKLFWRGIVIGSWLSGLLWFGIFKLAMWIWRVIA